MELYILRHAIAEPLTASVKGGDSERKLTEEGVRKMRRAARGMKAAKLSFDVILSSPHVRAKQTAEIVADVFGLEKRLELLPALTPDGNPKELLDALSHKHGKRKRVLLVGHEPYLSRLISVLISGDTRITIEFKKGGLCKLSAGALEYGRCATLEWLLTPGLLRKMS
jgi:phosphohistidine phosphatase